MLQAKNDISERHAEVMDLRILQVTEEADIAAVSQLACEIWPDHYKPIIGLAQVEYMLNRFQSPSAIKNQISEGYLYHLLLHKQTPLAYFAWLPNIAESSLLISKLYVANTRQRQGLGSAIIDFTTAYCLENNLPSMWLTVNRHNLSAINFYLKKGFFNAGTVMQQIGGGFVMDDFRMLKRVL